MFSPDLRAIAISNGRSSNASAQPDRRTIRLPTGRRRATADPAFNTGGNAPPMLAPSTSTRAVAGVSVPVPAREAISKIIATLEWHRSVRSAATSRAMKISPCSPCITA